MLLARAVRLAGASRSAVPWLLQEREGMRQEETRAYSFYRSILGSIERGKWCAGIVAMDLVVRPTLLKPPIRRRRVPAGSRFCHARGPVPCRRADWHKRRARHERHARGTPVPRTVAADGALREDRDRLSSLERLLHPHEREVVAAATLNPNRAERPRQVFGTAKAPPSRGNAVPARSPPLGQSRRAPSRDSERRPGAGLPVLFRLERAERCSDAGDLPLLLWHPVGVGVQKELRADFR